MRYEPRFPLIFDDAAVFPPGNAALADAVDSHRQAVSGRYADLVGPLVVRVDHLGSLEDLLGPTEPPLAVAVVATDVAGAVAALEMAREIDSVRLVALEISGATVREVGIALVQAPGGTEVTTYVELPRGDRAAGVIEALAASPYRAKIRTGGAEASMYPTEAELAATLVALARAGVPFKATAGLHHAVRATDPVTGFEQHGFLNLVVAAGLACRGSEVEEIAEVLAQRDPRLLPLRVSTGEEPLLHSIGTCSLAEPFAELSALGLIGPVR